MRYLSKEIIAGLPDNHPLLKALQNLSHDLRIFIELSFQEDGAHWDEWERLLIEHSRVKCWEKKACTKKGCPAFQNPEGRCWLIAGTMCKGKTQGEFALKYKSCVECEVYQGATSSTPMVELYEHIVTMIHSLKLTEGKLKKMAMVDPLTGVYNRNYFYESVRKIMEASKRFGDDLSIIIIDVDNFKYINDTFGHMHGDGVLKECAAIIGDSIRASDILCRFGGDEFVIASSKTGCSASKLVKRIEERINAWNDEYSSADYRLSFSIGCAEWDGQSDLETVINKADNRMYANKESKKSNRQS